MSQDEATSGLVDRWHRVALELAAVNPLAFSLLLRAAEIAVATTLKKCPEISAVDFFSP